MLRKTLALLTITLVLCGNARAEMPQFLTGFLETAAAATGLGVLFANLPFGKTRATPVTPAATTVAPPAVPEISGADVSGIMLLAGSAVLLRGRKKRPASDHATA